VAGLLAGDDVLRQQARPYPRRARPGQREAPGSAKVVSVTLGRLESMKPSARFNSDADLMAAFRNAYVELVNHTRPSGDGWGLVALEPTVNNDTWQELRSDVAQAAGSAGPLFARYGGTMSLRNAAYIMNNVNIVTNWEMSLRDPEQLNPDVIVSGVEAAVARARQEAKNAAEREHGLTGLIAAFLRWPSDLREAVGPGHTAQRAAAGAIGVFGQLVVATVGGALAVGLAAGAVQLWKLLI
jgi:hypothetical protein